MSEAKLIDWLLEAATPSIRYLTWRRLLGKSESDQNVREALATTGPIPAILSHQTEAGHWWGERSYYTPKYTATHWSMMLLAELAVDAEDSRFQRGIEFMLVDTSKWLEKLLAPGEGHGWLCFWGNLLRYALHGGCADDPRAQMVLRYIVRDALEKEWRCRHSDELPCAWGVARALWGLAALPESYRKPEIEQVIDKGLAFLLESHSLVGASYPTATKVSALWSRLNFPLFYQADILFVLRVVGELGALARPAARPALEWLRMRQKSNGRWQGASPYRQRTWQRLGGREETERWVSLQAATILRQAT